MTLTYIMEDLPEERKDLWEIPDDDVDVMMSRLMKLMLMLMRMRMLCPFDV